MKFDSDVAIVGGGPAGSVAAARLTELGFRATVFDCPSLKKRHRWETLSLEAFRFLEFLGAAQNIQDAVVRRTSQAVVHWADHTHDRRVAGFQLDRQRFDRGLQRFAEFNGVEICQPARVRRVIRSGEKEGGWTLTFKKSHESELHRTRFLVDAAGARDVLGLGRVPIQADTLSIAGTWTASLDEPVTFVEAMEQGWCWFSPTRDDQWIATVFVDPVSVQGTAGSTFQKYYENTMKASKFYRTLNCKSLTDRPVACSSTACRARVIVGDDWIKIGDSAMSYDPLSSQGIHCAMTNAYQSAVVIKAILRSRNILMAKVFYNQQAERRAREHVRNTTRLYSQQSKVCSTLFWHRSESLVPEDSYHEPLNTILLADKLQINRVASFCELPTLHGDEIVAETGLCIGGKDPISRFGGVPIKQLMDLIDGNRSGAELLSAWSQNTSPQFAKQFFEYLVSNRCVATKS